VRLLTARIPSSVNTRLSSPLNSSDTTAGNRRTSMPTASSVVCRLSTSRVTSASCTAFHQRLPAAPPLRLFREPKASRLGFSPPKPPAASPAPSPPAHPADPPYVTVSRRRCARSIADNRSWDGKAARRVSAPPSARDGGGARTPRCPRCMVGVPHPRVWEGRPPARVRCHHHAPLSTLLLSAVHPVTLYTPSQAPSHCKQEGCVCSACRVAQPFARPQRCNVSDASSIRRCWCSSDAEHTRGYVGLARCGGRGAAGKDLGWRCEG
jgi:hypothetical protein